MISIHSRNGAVLKLLSFLQRDGDKNLYICIFSLKMGLLISLGATLSENQAEIKKYEISKLVCFHVC